MLNGATGATENLQKLILSTSTSTLWYTYHSFLYQNLVHAGASTITNYRIYIAFVDTFTISAKTWNLQARSTTALITNQDDAGTRIYRYGAICLGFYKDVLYFGGSREVDTNYFQPLIGYTGTAGATEMKVQAAHYWDTSSNSDRSWAIDKIHVS